MSTGDFIAINLGKYDEPEYEEKYSPANGCIEYGKDNLFPQYLIGLYNSSAVHSALVNSIGQMVFGGGLTIDNVQGKIMIETLGLNKELRKASIDLKLQGGYYLECKWDIDRTKITSVRHIPFEEIRATQMDKKGEVLFYKHSLDWEDRQATVTAIRAWSPNDKKDHPVQLLACIPFTVGGKYYPKPDYMGAINWIEVDKQISIFHNNNIANGMAPSFAINWKNGTPPDEKRRAMRNDIEAQLSGPKNAGKFFMTFSDDKDSAPDFEPMPLSDAHQQYEFIAEESTNKIMIGHRVTSPALFGVKTAGQLGGTDELKTSAKLFQANVIAPMQQVLIECSSAILSQCGVEQKPEIQSENPMLTGDVDDENLGKVLEIVGKAASGELKAEAARTVLIDLIGLDAEVADKLLGGAGVEIEANLSSHELSDEEGAVWLDYLKTKGEKMDADEWELVEVEDIEDPDNEHLIHASEQVNFFKSYAKEGDKSEIDQGLYKVRYRYSRNISDKSRDFCKAMVSDSKAGTVYRFEDIQDMSEAGVNGQFAEKGKSTYSIFLYKGGAYCHHKWQRLVYFRKRAAGGQFLPNNGLKNDKRVAANAPIDRKDVAKGLKTATTPTDKLPNRGKVN